MIVVPLDIERPYPGPRTVVVAEIAGLLVVVCGESEARWSGRLTADEEQRARAALASAKAYESTRRARG